MSEMRSGTVCAIRSAAPYAAGLTGGRRSVGDMGGPHDPYIGENDAVSLGLASIILFVDVMATRGLNFRAGAAGAR